MGRNRRLDQHVKEAVAQIVEQEIADPRLTLVTITDVEVTPDQKYATVVSARRGARVEGPVPYRW